MKIRFIILSVSLIALLFATQAIASDSVELSTERGARDMELSGYSSGDMEARAYFGQDESAHSGGWESVTHSRENGGMRSIDTPSASGLGVKEGIDFTIGTSKEGGRW